MSQNAKMSFNFLLDFKIDELQSSAVLTISHCHDENNLSYSTVNVDSYL